MKRNVVSGAILGFVGYILSPLSWWNDLFVNIPIAYAFAWLVSLFHGRAFGPAFVAAYWFTNILGFFLMHKGVCKAVKGDCSNRAYWKKSLLQDVAFTLFYTVVVVALIQLNMIKPLDAYIK